MRIPGNYPLWASYGYVFDEEAVTYFTKNCVSVLLTGVNGFFEWWPRLTSIHLGLPHSYPKLSSFWVYRLKFRNWTENRKAGAWKAKMCAKKSGSLYLGRVSRIQLTLRVCHPMCFGSTQFITINYFCWISGFARAGHAWANFLQADERLFWGRLLERPRMRRKHRRKVRIVRQRYIVHRWWRGRSRGICSNRCYSWADDPVGWTLAILQNFAAFRVIASIDRYWYWAASLYASGTAMPTRFQWYNGNYRWRWRGACG